MLRHLCKSSFLVHRKRVGGGECLLSRQRKLIHETVRCSSQLYPTTSAKWEDAMIQAENVVGDSSNFSNLQKWVSGEFNNITKYLQRLVGTNHPMLETAKRCTYISEGKMGSAQARGLIVILMAKATEELARQQMAHDGHRARARDLVRDQISLAEMTEMTYSAYMIHRGVMDLKQHGLESVGFGSPTDSMLTNHELDPKQAKGLHYGNKVSVLCGDFLLAYVMRGLGDLFSSKAVDLVASAITDFMEGEFLLIEDWRNKDFLLSERSRNLLHWEQRTYSTIGSLQGNTCQAVLELAGIGQGLQSDAREFGKNLGLAWQAHTELQPFLNETYEPIQLPEMPAYPAYDLNCMPVVLYLRNSYKRDRSPRLLLNELKANQGAKFGKADLQIGPMNQHRHQEVIDYEKLHSMILEEGKAVEMTYDIIRGYSHTAINCLRSFPPSEAKNVLINICESLYRK